MKNRLKCRMEITTQTAIEKYEKEKAGREEYYNNLGMAIPDSDGEESVPMPRMIECVLYIDPTDVKFYHSTFVLTPEEDEADTMAQDRTLAVMYNGDEFILLHTVDEFTEMLEAFYDSQSSNPSHTIALP